MKKDELVEKISSKIDLTKRDIESVIDAFNDSIISTVPKKDGFAFVGIDFDKKDSQVNKYFVM